MMPLKLLQNFKYNYFFNASIPLFTNFNVAPLSSSPLIFSRYNKGKVHVVNDGDCITFANGLSTSSKLNISRIDPIDLTIDERGEKVTTIKKKKWKVKWQVNRSF
jgi:hypothetical protein